MIDRQRLAVGGGVDYGVVHINYVVVTWTANQSGLVTLTFVWPFDLESGVRVTCDVHYLFANFSLPMPLCSRLRPDVRDRQTDVRQHRRLMPPPRGQGITSNQVHFTSNRFIHNDTHVSLLRQKLAIDCMLHASHWVNHLPYPSDLTWVWLRSNADRICSRPPDVSSYRNPLVSMFNPWFGTNCGT